MLRGNWSSRRIRLRSLRGLSAQASSSPRAARSTSVPNFVRMNSSRCCSSLSEAPRPNHNCMRRFTVSAVKGCLPNQKSRTCRASSIVRQHTSGAPRLARWRIQRWELLALESAPEPRQCRSAAQWRGRHVRCHGHEMVVVQPANHEREGVNGFHAHAQIADEHAALTFEHLEEAVTEPRDPLNVRVFAHALVERLVTRILYEIDGAPFIEQRIEPFCVRAGRNREHATQDRVERCRAHFHALRFYALRAQRFVCNALHVLLRAESPCQVCDSEREADRIHA